MKFYFIFQRRVASFFMIIADNDFGVWLSYLCMVWDSHSCSHMLRVVSTALRGLHPSWWSMRACEQSASLESQEVRLYSRSVCHLTAATALQTDMMTESFPPRLLCWTTLIESQETDWVIRGIDWVI